MNDDPTRSADQDPQRIHVDADDQLQAWARKFDTTAEQIRDAVAAVGDHADDVEMHLKGTRSTSNAEAAERSGLGAGQAGDARSAK